MSVHVSLFMSYPNVYLNEYFAENRQFLIITQRYFFFYHRKNKLPTWHVGQQYILTIEPTAFLSHILILNALIISTFKGFPHSRNPRR